MPNNVQPTYLYNNIYWFQVDYSYDYKFLSESMSICKQRLVQICQPHLTPKSLKRIDNVFDFFSDARFLDALFDVEQSDRSKDMSSCLHRVIEDLRTLVDAARWDASHSQLFKLVPASLTRTHTHSHTYTHTHSLSRSLSLSQLWTCLHHRYANVYRMKQFIELV